MTPARDQQIRALYQAALERPASERVSFVAALAGGDEPLRQSVELMLSQQGATDVGKSAAPIEPAAELAVGTQFGQYRIESVRGGYDPHWRADGRELFFQSPAGAVMAVDIRAGDAFEFGAPRALFETGIDVAAAWPSSPEYFYDVTADGERFLINEPIPLAPADSGASAAAARPINVVVNWAGPRGE